jgi:hypothetical protein
MTNFTIQQQGSNDFFGFHELLNKVHTKETNFGFEFARRLLQPFASGRDNVSASPVGFWETGKIFSISCGRKFKSLLGEVVSIEPVRAGFVTLRKLAPLLILVPVVCTVRLAYRWLYRRQRRVEARIASVIQKSEENLVLHTEARVRYSTEYTHLAYNKISQLFEQGCLVIRRDGNTSSEDASIPIEFTRSDWNEFLGRGGDGLAIANCGVGSSVSSPNSVLKGTWHALWKSPPRLDAGLWDIQGKTQKVSYDEIYLGRDSNRRKIQYSSATDYGLCSGWLNFFYEVNDGVPNFLRNWTQVELPESVGRFFSWILPNHRLLTPPGETLPMWVPCYKYYRLSYLKLHRVKLISDKITATMRTDGNWNENVFLTTYRNLVSGNNQTSMGHKLSDPAMIEYLPLIRQRVYASRASSRVSE